MKGLGENMSALNVLEENGEKCWNSDKSNWKIVMDAKFVKNRVYMPEDIVLAARREETAWVHSEGVHEIVQCKSVKMQARNC